MNIELDNKVTTGRDCSFQRWIRNGESDGQECSYDSIVTNSTGISALTFAARCAQSEHLKGKVQVYGKPVEENRRLLAGVTLRARTLDYYAAACGVAKDEILERMYLCDPADAAMTGQYCSLATGSPEKGYSLSKVVRWMDSATPRRGRPSGLPLSYGIRNSRLNLVLQDLTKEIGVQFFDEPGLDALSLSGKALGDRPLIVNGTPFPIKDAPLTRPSQAPTQCVVAVQLPFSTPQLEKRGVIDKQSSFITWVHRDGALDMGVFNPFRDDLSPEATFYGILYRVIPGPKGVDKDSEQAILNDSLIGIADALGLEPVDPDETRGVACVPASPWKGTLNLHDGIFDVSRLSGAGAPIITGDGMTRAAVAGYVGAEAILAGRDAVEEVNTALRRYRQINWELCMLMTRIPGLASFGIRNFPSLVMYRNAFTYYQDMWAATN
jgi:hypothetical protein